MLPPQLNSAAYIQVILISSTNSVNSVSDHLKSSNNDAKSDEWLDCIHSSIIWGSSDKFQLFLKDIAQVISKQEFLQPAKV